MLDESVRSRFASGPCYLNTATVGLPPTAAVEALQQSIGAWQAGDLDPFVFDDYVDRSRAAFSHLVGTDVGQVAIASQVSVVSGLVASSMPDGAKILAAAEDFASVLFPFLADDRLDVSLVPLDSLVDHVDSSVDLVAVSAVQSSDGRVIDLDALASAAADAGARTYVDITQGAGWLPIDAGRFDVTSCGAYKWLCSPRGSGFMTVAAGCDWLQPRFANWYSGDDPWTSLYGAPLRIAEDGRRFNVSPAWFDFVGAAIATELLAEVGVDAINEYSVGLANKFRERLGLQPSNSTMVSLESDHDAALEDVGIKAAVRAGRVRLSFYLYNTTDDVDLAASVLR